MLNPKPLTLNQSVCFELFTCSDEALAKSGELEIHGVQLRMWRFGF